MAERSEAKSAERSFSSKIRLKDILMRRFASRYWLRYVQIFLAKVKWTTNWSLSPSGLNYFDLICNWQFILVGPGTFQLQLRIAENDTFTNTFTTFIIFLRKKIGAYFLSALENFQPFAFLIKFVCCKFAFDPIWGVFKFFLFRSKTGSIFRNFQQVPPYYCTNALLY